MDTKNSFADRIKKLHEVLGISSQQAFADKIGITKGNYNSYLTGSQPSLDKLNNILTNVENLNPNWLILGEGEMFLPKAEKIKEEPEDKTEGSDKSFYETIFIEKEKQLSNLIKTNEELVKNNTILTSVVESLSKDNTR